MPDNNLKNWEYFGPFRVSAIEGAEVPFDDEREALAAKCRVVSATYNLRPPPSFHPIIFSNSVQYVMPPLETDEITAMANEPFHSDSKDTCNRHNRKVTGKTTCIMCGGDGNVLVCSVSKCPVEVHSSCMSCPARFDDMQNFYCPYCLFKQSLAECQRAKKKVSLAEKAIIYFLDRNIRVDSDHQLTADKVKGKILDLSTVMQNRKGDDSWKRMKIDGGSCQCVRVEDRKEEKSLNSIQSGSVGEEGEGLMVDEQRDVLANSCKDSGKQSHLDNDIILVENQKHLGSQCCEDISSVIEEKKLLNESSESFRTMRGTYQMKISKTRISLCVEAGESIQLKNSRQDDCHQLEIDAKDQHQVELLDDFILEEITADAALHCLLKKNQEIANTAEECPYGMEVKGKMQDETQEYMIQSAKNDTAAGVHEKFDPGDESSSSCRDDYFISYPTCVRQEAHNSFKCKNDLQPGKFSVDKHEDHNAVSPRQSGGHVNRVQIPMTLNVRRKKLPWTAEEEEMLMEGIRKFASRVTTNLPWRKILEFGRHVFDGTRTPVDLKDKWRNIVKKNMQSLSKSESYRR
ncbi:hypothetical protein Nepgr_000689 [Nepenthes gracilis]|uniref:Myb-like domain-containing protein n=1 Tax=Nepenthes gracilis TaxID=150966 RepID=A0AAD3RX10_NEPGR|nr:hypothetical protein Nepgr_000689 [Nepenthes gracilis]